MTPRSAQPLSPSPDLRRNPASHGAVGAMLWSALSSPLSSAAARGWPYSPVMPPLSRPGSSTWRGITDDHARWACAASRGQPSAEPVRVPAGYAPRMSSRQCEGEVLRIARWDCRAGHAESEDDSVLLVTVRPVVGVTRRPAIRSVVAAEASPLPTGRPGSGLIPRSGPRWRSYDPPPAPCPDAALQWHQTRPHPAPLSGAQRTTRQSTRVRTEQTAVPATAKAEAGWLLWCRTSIVRHGCVGAFEIPGPWYTKLDLT
jgi:hypothetical protein